MCTLNELEQCKSDFLTAAEVAPIIGCDPHSIRVQAQDDPRMLGFPVSVIGRRVYIPREGFLNFCRAVGLGKKENQTS